MIRTRKKPMREPGVPGRLVSALVMLALFLGLAVLLDALRCSLRFIVAEYRIESEKLTAPVRVAMLSDLHESEFGRENADLISAVRAMEPDVIVCVGDMASRNASEEELRIPESLIAKLCEIAPVYLSFGNHEAEYVRLHGPKVYEAYERAGAVLLDRSSCDIEANGQRLRLGGIYGYCFRYGLPEEVYEASSAHRFLVNFCETDSFKLLLCHKPTDYYLESESEYFEDWDCDLVLSGHTHGGLIRLPFIGCPYLPQQGFFPKLDHGLKTVGSTRMVIGAGLGHGSLFFRLGVPCELVSIELVPA